MLPFTICIKKRKYLLGDCHFDRKQVPPPKPGRTTATHNNKRARYIWEHWSRHRHSRRLLEARLQRGRVFVLTLHILKSSNLYENLFCSNITYNLHNRWLIVFRLRHIILVIASLQPQFVVFAVKQQTAVNPLLCDPSVVFPQKRDNQSDLLNQSGTGPLNCRQISRKFVIPPPPPQPTSVKTLQGEITPNSSGS